MKGLKEELNALSNEDYKKTKKSEKELQDLFIDLNSSPTFDSVINDENF